MAMRFFLQEDFAHAYVASQVFSEAPYGSETVQPLAPEGAETPVQQWRKRHKKNRA